MDRMNIDLNKLGKNIKKAREYSKLSQHDVARFLGVDQSLISKYESGERAVSADSLDKLASLLCFSVKELLFSDDINPKGEVAFRTEGLTFEDNCILAKVNTIIKYNIFDLSNKALDLRRQMGEDSYSPIDIFAMVQRINNITLIMYPLGEHISGYCRKYEHTTIIVINSSMTVGRQRFSLAHELYHVYYDTSMTSFVCTNFNNKSQNEQEADIFASFLLMPQTALSQFKISNPISVDDIVKIEQFYRVSRKAVLYRLLNEGLISKQDIETFSQNVRYSAKRLGFSDYLYAPSSDNDKYLVLGKYITDAENLHSSGKISDGKYEEYLLSAFRDDLVYGFTDGGEIVD